MHGLIYQDIHWGLHIIHYTYFTYYIFTFRDIHIQTKSVMSITLLLPIVLRENTSAYDRLEGNS